MIQTVTGGNASGPGLNTTEIRCAGGHLRLVVFNPYMFNSADNQTFHFSLSKSPLDATTIQSPNSEQILAYAIVQKNLSGAGTPADWRVATVLSSAVSVEVGEDVAAGQVLYLQTYSNGTDFARCTVTMHWQAGGLPRGRLQKADVGDTGGGGLARTHPFGEPSPKVLAGRATPEQRKMLRTIGVSGLKSYSCCQRGQAKAINNILQVYDDFTDALLNPVKDNWLGLGAPVLGANATLVRYLPGATVGTAVGGAAGTALVELALPLASFAQISRWSSELKVFEAVGALGAAIGKVTERAVEDDCFECVKRNAWGQTKKRKSRLWDGHSNVRRIPLKGKGRPGLEQLPDRVIKPIIKPIIKKVLKKKP